ncbi:MAG: hypothetical protein RR454_00275 [Clostridia bacterium]
MKENFITAKSGKQTLCNSKENFVFVNTAKSGKQTLSNAKDNFVFVNTIKNDYTILNNFNFLLGKILTCDFFAPNKKKLASQHSVITQNLVLQALKFNVIARLILCSK